MFRKVSIGISKVSQLLSTVSKTAASAQGFPKALGRAKLYPASKLPVTPTFASSNGQDVGDSNRHKAALQVTTSSSTSATAGSNSWIPTAPSSASASSTSSANSDLHPCTLVRACTGGYQSLHRCGLKIPATSPPGSAGSAASQPESVGSATSQPESAGSTSKSKAPMGMGLGYSPDAKESPPTMDTVRKRASARTPSTVMPANCLPQAQRPNDLDKSCGVRRPVRECTMTGGLLTSTEGLSPLALLEPNGSPMSERRLQQGCATIR